MEQGPLLKYFVGKIPSGHWRSMMMHHVPMIILFLENARSGGKTGSQLTAYFMSNMLDAREPSRGADYLNSYIRRFYFKRTSG